MRAIRVVGVVGVATAAAAGLVGLGWILDSAVPPLLHGAFAPEAEPGVWARSIQQHAAQNPDHRTLDLYLAKWARGLRVGALLVALGWLLAIATCVGGGLRATWNGFWNTPQSPFDLAIFRMALFATVFWIADPAWIGRFAGLPDVLLFPPAGIGPWLAAIPRDPAWAEPAAWALRALCVTGMLGAFTRTSAAGVTLLGCLLVGIPQLHGKVSHYHHLFWFAALLAASPAGDALGVDGLRRAWRRGDVARPAPSLAHARPLRWVLLLLGVLYFFPGFWKWVVGGSDWILSDNLRLQVYRAWTSLGAERAPVDRYPWLLAAGALATLVFEMGMILAIWWRRLRPWAGASGLAFHNFTFLTLGIPFLSLQAMYVAFFEWARIFEWLGARLAPEPLVALHPPADRALACVARLDLFGRIEYRASSEVAALEVECGSHRLVGARAWSALLRRVPLLWPLLPWAALAPAPGPAAAAVPQGASAAPGWALSALALAMLLANVGYGVAGLHEAWPFACYPKFSTLVRSAELDRIGIEARDADGAPLDFDRAHFERVFERTKFGGLLRKVLATPEPGLRERRFAALWSVLSRHDPDLARAASVRFYSERISTLPSRWHENPLERHLVLEQSTLPPRSG